MPDVTANRARQDKLLASISRAETVEGLVFDQILTGVKSKQYSGLIGNYDNEHLRIEHDIVIEDQPYPRVTVNVKSSDRYQMEPHGLSSIVTEAQKKNEEQPFDALKDRTILLKNKLLLGIELVLATVLTSTATLTNNTTLSGTDQLDDYTSSDPLEVFMVARDSIYQESGQLLENGPNGWAVLPWQVFNKMRYHPKILENIKYVVNKKDGLSKDELAAAMGVSRLIVPWARQNTAKKGQTDAITPVWGKDIIFGYAPRKGSKMIQTLGFHVTPTDQNEKNRTFRFSTQNPPRGEEVLVDSVYDFLLTDVGCSYLIKDAVS